MGEGDRSAGFISCQGNLPDLRRQRQYSAGTCRGQGGGECECAYGTGD